LPADLSTRAPLGASASGEASPRGGANLIDGTALAKKIRAGVAAESAALVARGVTPGLAVVLVGDDPASAVYVGSKELTCIELGMNGETIRRPANITQTELIEIVDLGREIELHTEFPAAVLQDHQQPVRYRNIWVRRLAGLR